MTDIQGRHTEFQAQGIYPELYAEKKHTKPRTCWVPRTSRFRFILLTHPLVLSPVKVAPMKESAHMVCSPTGDRICLVL